MISVLDENCACVDTDFIIHIAETKCSVDDLLKYLTIAFEKKKLSGVMHPLVYEKELPQDKPIIQDIFSEKIVRVVDLKGVFADKDGEARKAYYSFLVPELFKKLTGKSFPVQDIFSEWRRKCSFGEIHSIALCLVCGCVLFLSDDNDSKRLQKLIKTDFGIVAVSSRSEFFNSDELKSDIPRRIRKQLAHVKV